MSHIYGYVKHAAMNSTGSWTIIVSNLLWKRFWKDLGSVLGVVWKGKSGDFVMDIIEK